jgi:hypothetical protein
MPDAESGETILVVLNNGDAGSGVLRLPVGGHFAEGQVLKSIPVEFDEETGQLAESTQTRTVRDGAIEVELEARGALLLAESRSE